jgi:Mg-chelatase subunit ChlD
VQKSSVFQAVAGTDVTALAIQRVDQKLPRSKVQFVSSAGTPCADALIAVDVSVATKVPARTSDARGPRRDKFRLAIQRRYRSAGGWPLQKIRRGLSP